MAAKIGFIEEFEERNAIRKAIKNAEWGKVSVEKFVSSVRAIDVDIADVLEEKASALGIDELDYTRVDVNGKQFDVYFDGKNYVVVTDGVGKKNASKAKMGRSKEEVVVLEDVVAPVEGGKNKRKSGGRRGEKTRIILDYLRKYMEIHKNEPIKIGPFYKYLREKGVETHRPQVFQIVKKYCVIEYTQTKGGRREIIIKGINA